MASRLGKILYSSSSDVNGPLCHSAADLYSVFKAIAGEDPQDSNSVDFSNLNEEIYRDADKSRILDDSTLVDYDQVANPDLRGITIGVVEEFQIKERDQRNKQIQQ